MSWLLKRERGQVTANEGSGVAKEARQTKEAMRATTVDSGEFSKTIAEEHGQMRLYKHFVPNSFLSSSTTCKHLLITMISRVW